MHSVHPDSFDERAVEAITTSTEAVAGLQEALTELGITLPSLGIDLLSCSRPLDPRPLIELGRCNLETAAALTAALRRVRAS
ncbi:hypothetical protein DB35_04240 [Streptomyces abyssalis]|uniref:Uncharacterized protein n=1 Tax=Streptomyces abyssalis TaxID=933944 RepID=A0A1E7JQB8_9ACTN|nr:hypothetical protein [Streptomyces abyssalis]OEU90435.1 hypothetical protein AN215_13345 [Streptomyces abyssalis]OEU95171.1 hypothetical protein DB35_04240 [Streptomyces abyssalis]OEV06192.1 hypothetical protein AN219_35375 [Streptomyces nanshensis]